MGKKNKIVCVFRGHSSTFTLNNTGDWDCEHFDNIFNRSCHQHYIFDNFRDILKTPQDILKITYYKGTKVEYCYEYDPNVDEDLVMWREIDKDPKKYKAELGKLVEDGIRLGHLKP